MASAENSVAKVNHSEERNLYGKSLLRKAMARLLHDRMTMIALAVILLLTLITGLAPVITDHILRIDPNDTNPTQNFLPPGSGVHILGTDDIGRDQLARLLHAGGVSMSIGFFGAGFSLVIGLFFGMVTGYFGGAIDDLINWLITTINSIPALYLLILFAAIFSPSAQSLILAIVLISWTGPTRLIRGQTLQIREQDYILAARAMGASPWRIMASHVMPNLISIAVIALALAIANFILLESALSFLGLGVQPPQATWGNMLSKSQQFFRQGPHLVIFPGVMIFITVLCFYILGDGVRDAFDPTLGD